MFLLSSSRFLFVEGCLESGSDVDKVGYLWPPSSAKRISHVRFSQSGTRSSKSDTVRFRNNRSLRNRHQWSKKTTTKTVIATKVMTMRETPTIFHVLDPLSNWLPVVTDCDGVLDGAARMTGFGIFETDSEGESDDWSMDRETEVDV